MYNISKHSELLLLNTPQIFILFQKRTNTGYIHVYIWNLFAKIKHSLTWPLNAKRNSLNCVSTCAGNANVYNHAKVHQCIPMIRVRMIYQLLINK